MNKSDVNHLRSLIANAQTSEAKAYYKAILFGMLYSVDLNKLLKVPLSIKAFPNLASWHKSIKKELTQNEKI